MSDPNLDQAPAMAPIGPRRILGLTPRLRFVVTGTGRSGTAYTARLLSAAGVPCRHEQWFTPVPGLRDLQTIPRDTFRLKLRAPASRVREEIRRRRQPIVGNASWLAVPRLPRFRGHIWLQVRHPLLVIGSLTGLGYIHIPNHPGSLWASFLNEHFHLSGDLLHDAARFWIEWNRRALGYARRVWRLEDMEPELLATLLKDLGISHPEERAQRAFTGIGPLNTARHRGFTPVKVSWDDIPLQIRRELRRWADRFGYE